MKKQAIAGAVSRLSKTLLYLIITLLWLIVIGAYVPTMLELPFFEMNQTVVPKTSGSTTISPSLAAVIVAAFGALLVIGLVVYVWRVIYVPAVEHAAEKMNETAQRNILKTLQKREPNMPKKQRYIVTQQVLLIAHLLAITIPVVLAYVATPISDETLRLVVQFVVTAFALVALLFLSVSRLSRRFA